MIPLKKRDLKPKKKNVTKVPSYRIYKQGQTIIGTIQVLRMSIGLPITEFDRELLYNVPPKGKRMSPHGHYVSWEKIEDRETENRFDKSFAR